MTEQLLEWQTCFTRTCMIKEYCMYTYFVLHSLNPRFEKLLHVSTVDDICGLLTPWNCWYGQLGLSSAPETAVSAAAIWKSYQQLWDCLPARFRHLHGNWKLSTPAQRRSASEDHLFCTSQMHWLLLLLLLFTVITKTNQCWKECSQQCQERTW